MGMALVAHCPPARAAETTRPGPLLVFANLQAQPVPATVVKLRAGAVAATAGVAEGVLVRLVTRDGSQLPVRPDPDGDGLLVGLALPAGAPVAATPVPADAWTRPPLSAQVGHRGHTAALCNGVLGAVYADEEFTLVSGEPRTPSAVPMLTHLTLHKSMWPALTGLTARSRWGPRADGSGAVERNAVPAVCRMSSDPAGVVR